MTGGSLSAYRLASSRRVSTQLAQATGFAVVAVLPPPLQRLPLPYRTGPLRRQVERTDNFGQGPFAMEIRSLRDGKYVQIGDGGQRTMLDMRDAS